MWCDENGKLNREQRRGESAVVGWLRSSVRSWTGGQPLLSEPAVVVSSPSSSSSTSPVGEGGQHHYQKTGDLLLSDGDRQSLHEALEYQETIAQVSGVKSGGGSIDQMANNESCRCTFQSTVPDLFMIYRVAISLNEGTLSIFESMEKPIARLMVRQFITQPPSPPPSGSYMWFFGMIAGRCSLYISYSSTFMDIRYSSRCSWSVGPRSVDQISNCCHQKSADKDHHNRQVCRRHYIIFLRVIMRLPENNLVCIYDKSRWQTGQWDYTDDGSWRVSGT